jgi:hypothetical protein
VVGRAGDAGGVGGGDAAGDLDGERGVGDGEGEGEVDALLLRRRDLEEPVLDVEAGDAAGQGQRRLDAVDPLAGEAQRDPVPDGGRGAVDDDAVAAGAARAEEERSAAVMRPERWLKPAALA